MTHARDELSEAAAGDASASGRSARRLLEGVGDVGDDGAVCVPHELHVSWIHDEVRVSEHGAPLADHDVRVARGSDLLRRVPHHAAGAELALLDVDDGAGLAGRHEEVGLAAQEGGNLHDVRDLGGGHGRGESSERESAPGG